MTHRVRNVVMVEPDFEIDGEAALVEAGFEVRRFATRHHFFGGVSRIGRAGPGADSRRDHTTHGGTMAFRATMSSVPDLELRPSRRGWTPRIRR